MVRKILTAVVVIAILAAGFFGFTALNAGKRPPSKKANTESHVTLVEVAKAPASHDRVRVEATGSVVAARTLTVVPRVGGEVLERHPQLVAGGRVAAGETLVKVDPADYDLAIRMRRSDVKQAQASVETEKAEKAVAESEWARLGDSVQPTAAGRRLALREVQKESADAALQSVRAGLSAAKLDKKRTSITAPFDAIVIDSSLEKGQVINIGSPIATLVASDAFWVRVSLPLDRLSWLQIPGVSCDQTGCGSVVEVSQDVGGTKQIREGRILRLLGDLDPLGKMARLLVEVPRPLETSQEAPLPLLLGTHVTVVLNGPELQDVVAIPRATVRDGGKVWVVEDGRLAFRDVEIVWSFGEQHFVRGELRRDDDIVTSRIGVPIEGMTVAVDKTADELPERVLATKERRQ